MDNVVSLKNINKIYGTQIKTQVLYDINLDFARGSFNSIIGASGSGKSTMLNILGTLDSPTSGKIFIDNISTERMTRTQLAMLRNEKIGFVFQFHYLLPEFTARENLLIPYLIKNKKTNKEIEERADMLLELVGLQNVKNNLATKMSGGQQQRTAIARALINSPQLILADEPTGNLDSESTENIYKLFRNINEQTGTTFIIITHDRNIAQKADRIIEMKDGRINLDITK